MTSHITSEGEPGRIGHAVLSVLSLAQEVVTLLKDKGFNITTMESCSGGMIADMLTSIPGASEVMTKASVTYANESKIAQGVDAALIEQYTVYSREIAEAMAQASLNTVSNSYTIGIGVTGSLSRVDPANTENSIPGEVHIAIAYGQRCESRTIHVEGAARYEAKLEIARHVMADVKAFINSYD